MFIVLCLNLYYKNDMYVRLFLSILAAMELYIDFKKCQ